MKKVQPLLGLDRQFNEILPNALDKRDRVTVTTPGTPDTEFSVAHGLGVVPTGFLVIDKDKAGDTYRGTTAWTAEQIYLKNDVATVALTLLVF